MMSMDNAIEKYRRAVVQIATPSNTGTGFYLYNYNVLITNEHVVRDNRKVVVDGLGVERQLVDVLYVDPLHDLAFLAVPSNHTLGKVELSDQRLKEGNEVLAIGHPFGFKFTTTGGIVSSLTYMMNEVEYIQHDAALNPGNSGGPLVGLDEGVVGVNTFIIKDGNNVGFSLPVTYIRDSLNEFSRHGLPSVRCNSCLKIVVEQDDPYCPHCGSRIRFIKDIEDYEPFGIPKVIERLLEKLGEEIELCRRGPNKWEIHRGSAQVDLTYHHKSGLIIGDALLCTLPSENILKIYAFLLQQNCNLGGLTFSVKDMDIILSVLIHDQYLDEESGMMLLARLFESADAFDDVLVERFGASWKREC